MLGAPQLGSRALALMEEASTAGSIDELAAAVRRVVEPLGLDAVSCAMVTGAHAAPARHFFFLDWPEDWLLSYQEEKFFEIDPIPRWAIGSRRAASFTEVAGLLPRKDPGLRVVEAARCNGFGEGLLVPVFLPNRSVGIVSLGGDRDGFSQHERAFLELISHVAFLRASALERDAGSGCDVRLSCRELDCIALLVRGYSNSQIATRLGVAEATVRFHLGSARRKTGASTRTHLAAIAIWLGLARL